MNGSMNRLLPVALLIFGFGFSLCLSGCLTQKSEATPKVVAAHKPLSKYVVASRENVKLPADFQFPLGEDSPGPVVFSHESHYDYESPNCVSCHGKHFNLLESGKSPEGPINMDTMSDGKNCGACHNGDLAFDSQDPELCSSCHQGMEE
ncbi:MAG: hypothetical protein GXO74_15120 [Calditrichaeota bacterium]|nr:hypothetical protein [Calditrichota bacterium]